MEVHTAAREKVPLVIALMNNRSYGNIYYRASKMGPGPERLTDIPGIDWVAFAGSMGGEGERVERPDDIAAAVGRALRATGPYLLDLHTDKTYPTPVMSGGNASRNGRTTTDGQVTRSHGYTERCRTRAVRSHGVRTRSRRGPHASRRTFYVRMFNNPGVTAKVGALGEHLRFHGVLPDAVRELVILRFSARQQYGYEWSHHQRPAKLAGLGQDTIDALTAGQIPDTLPDASQAAIEAVDAVVAKRSIPAEVQQRFVEVHGNAGIVECSSRFAASTPSWAVWSPPSISRSKKGCPIRPCDPHDRPRPVDTTGSECLIGGSGCVVTTQQPVLQIPGSGNVYIVDGSSPNQNNAWVSPSITLSPQQRLRRQQPAAGAAWEERSTRGPAARPGLA